MPDIKPTDHPSFDQFVATIAALRAPDGCPWDKEQTHKSIAPNMMEEAYEAVDAIEQNDVAHMREELGDVLLQVVLQSQIAKDDGEFDIDDVCKDVNDKIVRRHPHVFGDAESGTANEVITLWDKIKLEEKPVGEKKPGLLDSMSRNFPALMQAQKISRKAAAAGFEWDTIDDVWAKVDEEICELKEAYANAAKDDKGKLLRDDEASTAESAGDADNIGILGDADASGNSSSCDSRRTSFHDVELEFGDVMFTMVNIARRMGINSEQALRDTCNKFRNRWEMMEDMVEKSGKRIEDLSTEAMNELWDKTKRSAD